MAPLRFLRALYCVDADYKPLSRRGRHRARLPGDGGRLRAVRRREPGLCSRRPGSPITPIRRGCRPTSATPNEPDYAELAAIDRARARCSTGCSACTGHTKRSRSGRPSSATRPRRPIPGAGTVSPPGRRLLPQLVRVPAPGGSPRSAPMTSTCCSDPPRQRPYGFATGLLTSTGAPKPGYYAFRMPLYLPVTETAQGPSARRVGRRAARRPTRRPDDAPPAGRCRSSSDAGIERRIPHRSTESTDQSRTAISTSARRSRPAARCGWRWAVSARPGGSFTAASLHVHGRRSLRSLSRRRAASRRPAGRQPQLLHSRGAVTQTMLTTPDAQSRTPLDPRPRRSARPSPSSRLPAGAAGDRRGEQHPDRDHPGRRAT